MVRYQSAVVVMGVAVFIALFVLGSGIQDMPILKAHFLAPSPFTIFHIGVIAAMLGVVSGVSLHEKYAVVGSAVLSALAMLGFILGGAPSESLYPTLIVGVSFGAFCFVTAIGFSWFDEFKDAREHRSIPGP
jgi:hypothetical protein